MKDDQPIAIVDQTTLGLSATGAPLARVGQTHEAPIAAAPTRSSSSHGSASFRPKDARFVGASYVGTPAVSEMQTGLGGAGCAPESGAPRAVAYPEVDLGQFAKPYDCQPALVIAGRAVPAARALGLGLQSVHARRALIGGAQTECGCAAAAAHAHVSAGGAQIAGGGLPPRAVLPGATTGFFPRGGSMIGPPSGGFSGPMPGVAMPGVADPIREFPDFRFDCAISEYLYRTLAAYKRTFVPTPDVPARGRRPQMVVFGTRYGDRIPFFPDWLRLPSDPPVGPRARRDGEPTPYIYRFFDLLGFPPSAVVPGFSPTLTGFETDWSRFIYTLVDLVEPTWSYPGEPDDWGWACDQAYRADIEARGSSGTRPPHDVMVMTFDVFDHRDWFWHFVKNDLLCELQWLPAAENPELSFVGTYANVFDYVMRLVAPWARHAAPPPAPPHDPPWYRPLPP